MLKIERLESQAIYSFGSDKTKGPKQDSQNQLRSLMLEGGEPTRYCMSGLSSFGYE